MISRVCTNCGQPLCWQSDFDAEELGIVSFWDCHNPNCMTNYELFMPEIDDEKEAIQDARLSRKRTVVYED